MDEDGGGRVVAVAQPQNMRLDADKWSVCRREMVSFPGKHCMARFGPHWTDRPIKAMIILGTARSAQIGAKMMSTQGAQGPWHAVLRDQSLQFTFPDAGPAPVAPTWPRRVAEFIL